MRSLHQIVSEVAYLVDLLAETWDGNAQTYRAPSYADIDAARLRLVAVHEDLAALCQGVTW